VCESMGVNAGYVTATPTPGQAVRADVGVAFFGLDQQPKLVATGTIEVVARMHMGRFCAICALRITTDLPTRSEMRQGLHIVSVTHTPGIRLLRSQSGDGC